MADIPLDDHDSNDHDSDEDVEFEDVPGFRPVQAETPAANVSDRPSGRISPVTATIAWVPQLHMPPQRAAPYPSGSDEEVQLRGRLSEAIERIEFRHMKTQMSLARSIDEPDHIRYKSVQELANDIADTADMLWSSVTPSVEVEGMITLAGIFQRALRTYPFDPIATITLLNKLDYYLASLIEGKDSMSQSPLPGANPDRPLVTATQRVRIRSIAENSRTQLFSIMPSSGENSEDEADADADADGAEDENEEDQDDNEAEDLNGGDDDGEDLPEFPSWMTQAARVYERVLMLTGA